MTLTALWLMIMASVEKGSLVHLLAGCQSTHQFPSDAMLLALFQLYEDGLAVSSLLNLSG
jgi:hypothetical protein